MKNYLAALFIIACLSHYTIALANVPTCSAGSKETVLSALVDDVKEELKSDPTFVQKLLKLKSAVNNEQISPAQFWDSLMPEIQTKATALDMQVQTFIESKGFSNSSFDQEDFWALFGIDLNTHNNNTNATVSARLPCTEQSIDYAASTLVNMDVAGKLSPMTGDWSTSARAVVVATMMLLIDDFYCSCMVSKYGTC